MSLALRRRVLSKLTEVTPDQIPNLGMWLKADGVLWQDGARTIPAVANGDPVGVWVDASPAALNATSLSDAGRPTLNTNVHNTKPGMSFDGVDDTSVNNRTASARPITAVWVASFDDFGGYLTPLGPSSNGGRQFRPARDTETANARKLQLVSSNTVLIATANTPLAIATPVIASVTYDAAGNWAFYYNGAADGAGTNNVAFVAGRTTGIGSSGGFEYMKGRIFEVIEYDRVLTSAELSDLHTYLKNKYNIAKPVTDSFNRADSTTTLGSADTGQAWVNIGNGMGIATNRAYGPAANNSTEHGAYVESGVANVEVSVAVPVAGYAYNGVYGRFTDTNNFWRLDRSETAWRLLKKASGSYSSQGSGLASSTDPLKLSMVGSTIKAYVGSSLVATVTDAFNSTATRHGIEVESTVTRFDDFKIIAAPALVSDSFNRADSTTTMGNADTGQAWTAQRGTWGIAANRAYQPGNVGDASAVVEAGQANMAVEATFVTRDGGTCVLARVTDADNYYLLLGSNGGVLVIYKKVAGAYTELGRADFTPVVDGDVLRLTANGSTLSAHRNGALSFSVTDSAFAAQTKAGLRADSSVARFDDFKANPA